MEKRFVRNGITVIDETVEINEEEIAEAATYIVDTVNLLLKAIKAQKTA